MYLRSQFSAATESTCSLELHVAPTRELIEKCGYLVFVVINANIPEARVGVKLEEGNHLVLPAVRPNT